MLGPVISHLFFVTSNGRCCKLRTICILPIYHSCRIWEIETYVMVLNRWLTLTSNEISLLLERMPFRDLFLVNMKPYIIIYIALFITAVKEIILHISNIITEYLAYVDLIRYTKHDDLIWRLICLICILKLFVIYRISYNMYWKCIKYRIRND